MRDLFLFGMKGHGLQRMKKKGPWFVVSYPDNTHKGVGLEALKALLNTEDNPSTETSIGRTVHVHSIHEISFSFVTKLLRVRGKIALV